MGWSAIPEAPRSPFRGEPRFAPLQGTLQFRDDFAAHLSEASGLSLEARPDALTFERTVVTSLGPFAEGDATRGVAAFPWLARATPAAVYVRRMDAGEEYILFEYTGAPILSLALAFEQSGRPVVAAERSSVEGGASEVWIYHYDPLVAAFVFENFGPGRTPAAILDDEDTVNGDVQVFYVDSGDRLVHRQQRNRYRTVFATPFTGDTDTRLELAARVEGCRLALILSQRSVATGTYALIRVETQLFPSRAREELIISAIPLGGILAEQGKPQPEDLRFVGGPLSGRLRDVVQSTTGVEGFALAGIPKTGVLRAVILSSALPDERLFLSAAPVSASLTRVIVTYSPQPEHLRFAGAPLGGTLSV